MNQKLDNTSNITTNKPVRYAVAPGVTMDEKTYHQYISDVKKSRSRAIKLTIGVVAVWAIYALFVNFDDVFFSPVFTLTIILGGIFYFLSLIYIQVKYKIPLQFKAYGGSSHSYLKRTDPYLNNDPYCPGTSAWYTYGGGSQKH